METRLRNRDEVNAIGDLVAEMFWIEDEIKALTRSADRRDDIYYRQLRDLNRRHYDAKKRIKEWIEKKRGEK